MERSILEVGYQTSHWIQNLGEGRSFDGEIQSLDVMLEMINSGVICCQRINSLTRRRPTWLTALEFESENQAANRQVLGLQTQTRREGDGRVYPVMKASVHVWPCWTVE